MYIDDRQINNDSHYITHHITRRRGKMPSFACEQVRGKSQHLLYTEAETRLDLTISIAGLQALLIIYN